MPTWNADLYLQYANERTQPSIDLTTRIQLENPRQIIDLGCGPGNSTAVLRGRWPAANIVGLDNSPAMIAKARADFPDGAWELAEIPAWRPDRRFDLVFSNAALHWVPDHATVIPHLFAQVAPGGALAVQMPAHLESPVHRAMLEIADDPEWQARTAPAKGLVHVETPEFYYDLLCRAAARIDLWVTTYEHVMAAPEAIIEWIRGTGLRPFLEALSTDDQRARFTTKLLERAAVEYPSRSDGKVIFPFRRLFFVAYCA
jgi:trans-aconitate 2-methyltransferase